MDVDNYNENIDTSTVVDVKSGFCGYPFRGIVMDSFAMHKGFSHSFLDATMYRVAEIMSVGPDRWVVKTIHKWVPCELMENHDTCIRRAHWATELLREFVAREVDEVPAMCDARLKELTDARN